VPQRLLAASVTRSVDRAGLLSMGWAFFCFIPYPGYPIGNTSALQIGNILTLLLCIPLARVSWERRPYWIYGWILAPLLISTVRVAVSQDGDLGLAVKGLPTYIVSCLALIVVQFYAPRYALHLLTGIAAATLLHVAVGIYQIISFEVGHFPLFRLYVNQSFLSVQASAGIIANHIQRPFGIFPEPSAMSSSLAPFVLLWSAQMSGLLKLRQEPTRWQQMLFATAAVGGLTLIIVSRSGHAAITVLAMLPMAIAWVVRCRATLRTFIMMLAVFGLLLPLLVWFASTSLGDRLGGGEMGNSSWEERSTSLRTGFELMFERGLTQMVFGLGVGQTAPALWDKAQIDAVFSVLLTYVYETGLVGLGAVCAMGYYLLRLWRSQRRSLVFSTMTFVWLVGITITTSYTQLLPLWIALGWLTVWPEVCQPESGIIASSRRAVPARAPPNSAPVTRDSRWLSPKGAA
jgi:hypothetical protein